jgi:hypothetical protein
MAIVCNLGVAFRRRPPLTLIQRIKLVGQFSAAIEDLAHRKLRDSGIVLLDQGPLYEYLSFSRYVEPNPSGALRIRFGRMLTDEYGSILDGIVYLSAPVDVLLQRVTERDLDHQLKRMPDNNEKSQFLTGYINEYEQLIAQMRQRSYVKVLSVDTGTKSLQEVYEEVACWIATEVDCQVLRSERR